MWPHQAAGQARHGPKKGSRPQLQAVSLARGHGTRTPAPCQTGVTRYPFPVARGRQVIILVQVLASELNQGYK